MPNKNEDRKEARRLRDEQDEQLLAQISGYGRRFPVERFAHGSVRTTIWHSEHLPCVIEQYRFYATSQFVGLTSLLEASDLYHARRGLAAVKAYSKAQGWRHSVQSVQQRAVVLQAVSRGYNSPRATFVEGNIAALLWLNDVNNGVDFVAKIELLAVNEARVPECFFDISQIDRVNECLLLAEDFLTRQYAVLRNSWDSKKNAPSR